MKTWVIAVLLGLGLILILAATGSGRDHTGKVVRAETWANDVCGTAGTWAGDMKAIREEFQDYNYGAEKDDGTSGDGVESAVTLRVAVDRAYVATTKTLDPGFRRAGIPDAPHGAEAVSKMRDWADRTETSLLSARNELKTKPPSSSYASQAYAELAPSDQALSKSIQDGLATIDSVKALDPALHDAFERSSNCRRLDRKTA